MQLQFIVVYAHVIIILQSFTPEGDEQNDNLKRKRSNDDIKPSLDRNNPSVIKHVLEEDDDDDDVRIFFLIVLTPRLRATFLFTG